MMETKELVKSEKNTQKIQLVNGEFTPSEASHVIIALLNEKINFHKIQRLQLWEGNHKYETNQLDSRIKDLQEEKRIASEFLSRIQGNGKKLKINGILEISVTE
jgi:hypothetical protein